MNSAAQSAITRVSSRNRAPGSTLRMIANMPPIQDTSGARKNEIESAPSSQSLSPWVRSAGKNEITIPIGVGGRTSADASLIADSTTSVSTESATMAERNVMRAAGRTKKAATATAMTSHAISALRPYGLKTGDGIASRYWMTPRTSASTRVQPTRADNPTSGGFGVGRQMAARAANLNTDHTLVTPSRSRISTQSPCRDRVSPRSFGIKARRWAPSSASTRTDGHPR